MSWDVPNHGTSPDPSPPLPFLPSSLRYGLPSPQAMFDLDYFLHTSQAPFYDFCVNSLLPSTSTRQPTVTHHFLGLLESKGLLRRCYTQNIDMLERLAGVTNEMIYEVHGTLKTASCANERCRRPTDGKSLFDKLKSGRRPTCDKCGSPQKPDIVFFGEKMPRKVQEQIKLDMPDMRKCDLLLVMGTSLAVQPFASFVDAVPRSTPRVFFNVRSEGSGRKGEYEDRGGGHAWGRCGNYRDLLLEGDCDRVVTGLCRDLGWLEELQGRVREWGGEGEEERIFGGNRRGSSNNRKLTKEGRSRSDRSLTSSGSRVSPKGGKMKRSQSGGRLGGGGGASVWP